MPQTYVDAEAVQNIAKGLIANFHPDLATAEFRFVFKEKAGKKAGKTIYGTVKKMSDLMKFLIEADYLMEVALDTWNEMDETRRTALVDHLLERCQGEEDEETGEMKWKTREPDVHEFSSILRRYGAWTQDLEGFCSVAQSLDLNFMTGSVEEEDQEQVQSSTA